MPIAGATPTPRVLLPVATKHFHVRGEEGGGRSEDAAGNLKDKVKNATEETKDSIKATAKSVERNMNTKM
ncbi:unnamed protein product [Arabidopsis lyrata]|uniref:Predicted protein n=1 Tax=Arabidopsis lyrata subsp. lyrata TaxID=81972 RepID=D7L569_ARALL|nr:predicted protein [Arabidopsis lyrata subsp. lyrata]CAH8261740.1 unnamed protein product [Arabidopsis lyrata]